MCSCAKSGLPACFCELKGRKVVELARKKFSAKVPTVELLRSRRNPGDKRIVATLALLDVPLRLLRQMMGDRPEDLASLLDCRQAAIERLGRQGIEVLSKAA